MNLLPYIIAHSYFWQFFFFNPLFNWQFLFPGGSDGEESAWNAGDLGWIPVGMMPWRRKWLLTPVFLNGKSHGQRSLEGYGLLDWRESAPLINQHFVSNSLQMYIIYLSSIFELQKLYKLIRTISGEGDGTPLQYSCLESPMDGGAW